MAIARDAFASTGAFSNYTSRSYTHTCSGNQRVLIVVVMLSQYGATAVSGISATYGGVSMTLVRSYQTGTTQDSGNVAIFVLGNPANGANTVAVSWSGFAYGEICSHSFSGADVNNPIIGNATTWVYSTSVSINVPSISNSFCVDGTLFFSTSATSTGNGSQTKVLDDAITGNGNSGRALSSWIASAANATTTTMQWSSSATCNIVTVGVCVRPAPPTGVPVAVSPAYMF